jgi:hypothetical protein
MNRWNVFNGVLFQVAWFACVLGGAAGTNLWGVAVLLLMLGQSLAGPAPGRDLKLVAALAPLGFLLDTAWIQFGVLDYGAALAPPWIVLLWVGVGLAVHHCLSWFKERPWLGGLLAGAGAPFSYLAGERFGAVTIDDPLRLTAVALVWLVLFAAVFTLAAGGRPASGSRNDYERAH